MRGVAEASIACDRERKPCRVCNDSLRLNGLPGNFEKFCLDCALILQRAPPGETPRRSPQDVTRMLTSPHSPTHLVEPGEWSTSHRHDVLRLTGRILAWVR